MRNRKFNKNSKKLKKKKSNTIIVHFKPKQVGKGREIWKIKIIASFRSYPTRNRKFQKNNKKIKKYYYEFISSQTRLEIDEKVGNKNYRFVQFLPDVKQKIPKKKQQKNSKN